MRRLSWCMAALLSVASLACSDDPVTTPPGGSGGAGGGGGMAPDSGLVLLGGQECDSLVPSHCGFPYPSDVWRIDDPTKVTGKRVHFGATTLPSMLDNQIPGTMWADHDGFSAGAAILAHLPGATVTGLPTPKTIPASLLASSPTILLDAETLERVPHFAELDMSTDDDTRRAFMIRPAVRLHDARRYIVAIRNVVDDGGSALEPSPVFQALRDRTSSDDPTVAPRRALYDDIFAKLGAANVDTSDLQLAWDFTTASRENNTRFMVHMRDEALALLETYDHEYQVDEVIEDPNPNIRRRIVARFRAPMYMTSNEEGQGRLNLGQDGLPEPAGDHWFEFHVNVPHAATSGTPGALLQNAHGLLGKLTEGDDGYQAQIANRTNKVMFATKMWGMASADEEIIAQAIALGDMEGVRDFFERQHQGLLNALLAMRVMKESFHLDQNVQFGGVSAIDPTERYYRGDSQGGIFGTSYMALTTDVERGLLGEPGMPYSLLLNRSVDFTPFFIVFQISVENPLDLIHILGLIQMFWDRVEPNGYAPYINGDTLPGTPSHEVLLHVALGDYQVTPLGAHLIARSVGAKNVAPVNREVFGVPTTDAPFGGSGLVEFGFGLPELPITNVPPSGPKDLDPHDSVRVLEASIDQADTFFRTGMITQTCSGVCDPE